MENADKRNTRLLKHETQIKCEANKDLTDPTQADTKQHNKTNTKTLQTKQNQAT